MTEYRLKSAFLYNFVAFTEWPDAVGDTLMLCVYGPDPFGDDLDKLQDRSVGARKLDIRRTGSVDGLTGCQVVFVTREVFVNLPRVLDRMAGQPVLIVADTPGATREGVALNMSTEQRRVSFEANVVAARAVGLTLSSKLLRLASEVRQ